MYTAAKLAGKRERKHKPCRNEKKTISSYHLFLCHPLSWVSSQLSWTRILLTQATSSLLPSELDSGCVGGWSNWVKKVLFLGFFWCWSLFLSIGQRNFCTEGGKILKNNNRLYVRGYQKNCLWGKKKSQKWKKNQTTLSAQKLLLRASTLHCFLGFFPIL